MGWDLRGFESIENEMRLQRSFSNGVLIWKGVG